MTIKKKRMGALTNADYWDRTRPSTEVVNPTPDRILEPYLKNILPANPNWTCLEIGVIPGNLLLWFSQYFQYKVFGLDFSSRVHQLKDKFLELGIDAEFEQADFLDWNPNRTFEVVFSYGLVEHFDEYDKVIEAQWDMVAPGGYLVIGIPAWTPIQKTIRRIVYTSEHYKAITTSHNTKMMNLRSLLKAVEKLPRSEIVFGRYIMNMRVWIKPNHMGVRKWTAPLFPFVRIIERIIRRLSVSHSFFSPYILVVARKERMEYGYGEAACDFQKLD